MKCDRCNHELNFVYEDVIESSVGSIKEGIYHVQEFYCPRMQKLYDTNLFKRRFN